AQQPRLVGLQVGDAGVASVAVALEHGNRALHQVQAAGVLEAQAVQGVFRGLLLVVDRDALGLDVLVDDRQQDPFLPRQADGLLNPVWRKVPRRGGDGGPGGAWANVEFLFSPLRGARRGAPIPLLRQGTAAASLAWGLSSWVFVRRLVDAWRHAS